MTEQFPLWPLKKKVVYIDQFAISNMMKAIDVTAKAHGRTAADPFWLTLFETLERVCKLQLAICPYSDEHVCESRVSPFFDALERMYEQFSHGVSFHTAERITQEQLSLAATAWLRGEVPRYDLNPESVTYGGQGLHSWQDRLIISVKVTYPDEMIESIREFRERLHEGVVEFFQECRATREPSYAYWFNRERNASRQGILDSVRAWAEGRLTSSFGLDRFHLLRDLFHRNGVNDAEFGHRVREFLESDAFRDFPASDIATRMWAVIAQKAANGQRRPPNRGTINDINVVSTLLPYCDAMLVDNGCRALLDDIPADYAIGYAARIFSRSSGDEFIEYLKRIEAEVDPVVLSLVHRVYGENWPTPFLAMYECERARERRRGRRRDRGA